MLRSQECTAYRCIQRRQSEADDVGSAQRIGVPLTTDRERSAFASTYRRERCRIDRKRAIKKPRPGRRDLPVVGSRRLDHERNGLERVKGIEPSYSAWKAAALPLSYTRIAILSVRPLCRPSGNRRSDDRLPAKARSREGWWRGLDSNQRRHSQRIYSPSPLATRAPLRGHRKIDTGPETVGNLRQPARASDP